MVVYLPSALTPDEVREDLTLQGLETVKVEQFQKKTDAGGSIQLPVFAVTFKKGTVLKNILNIRAIAYCRVHWQKYKSKNLVIRCFRCQSIGHLAMHCHKVPKCDHCANNHDSKDCPHRNVMTAAKCANCGGAHRSSDNQCPTLAAAVAKKRYRILPRNQIGPSDLLDSAQFPALFKNSNTNATSQNEAASSSRWGPRHAQRQPQATPEDGNTLFSLFKSLKESFDFTTIFSKLKYTLLKIKSAPDTISKIAILAEFMFSFLE